MQWQNNSPIPRVGIEWAQDLEKEISENLDRIEGVEIIPENFFDGKNAYFLSALREKNIPVQVHAVEISIATAGYFREEHLQKVLQVAEQVPTVNISDHLCLTEAGGIEVGQLTPIPWTSDQADIICRNIDHIQSLTNVPFLIENITHRFMIPDMEFSETDFINHIVDRTGCNVLLDVTNVFTNATNFGFDPYEWIDQLNLKPVTSLHLAGGYTDDQGTLVDSHSRRVPAGVWELFKYVAERTNAEDVVVEWTEDCPPIEEVLKDMDIAKSVLKEIHQSQKTA